MSEEKVSNLEAKVRKWLMEEGYPLEMQVASVFNSSGFGVSQSAFWQDQESGKWRETDVLAGTDVIRPWDCNFEGAVTALAVVECKASTSYPWVLFTGKGAMMDSPQDFAASLPHSEVNGKHLLWKSSSFLPLFRRFREKVGYSLTCAFTGSSQKDVAYSALTSVLKSAYYWAEKKLDALLFFAPEEEPSFIGLVLAVPIVVISAPLLRAHLSNNQLVVEEIDIGLVFSQAAFGKKTPVFIVTEDMLGRSVSWLNEAFSNLEQHYEEVL